MLPAPGAASTQVGEEPCLPKEWIDPHPHTALTGQYVPVRQDAVRVRSIQRIVHADASGGRTMPKIRRVWSQLLLAASLLLPAGSQAVVVGSLAARFDDTYRGGGVVVAGASLSGRSDGVANTTASITIAGIPAGAVVQRAFLYWAISGGLDTSATINGFAVTGANILVAGATCWGSVVSATYRADVSARVGGNGSYIIGGLPSSTNPAAADTDGAALVVLYSRPDAGAVRRIMIRDGAITTSAQAELVSDTFAGLASPISSVGRFHLVVGDGQSDADGNLVFNATVLGTSQFNGGEGALWDVATYNVPIPAALGTAAWSHVTGFDCLLFETAIVEFDVAQCGDSLITSVEACDDGDAQGGDGCSAICEVEPGWQCSGEPSTCALLPDNLFQDGFE